VLDVFRRHPALWHLARDHRENQTFMGEEDLLRARGVRVDVLQDPRCIELMTAFIEAHPALWNEDIGV
jgi:cytosine deaminase